MAPASTLPNWAQISSNKRDSRDELIPSKWRIPESARTNSTNLLQVPITCGILTAEEIAITSNFDAVALVEALKNSTFSAEAVTTAFCKRAAIAQQLTNCLTEIFFDEAIKNAKSLDLERQKNPGTPLKPLHGLPISLKDSFHVKGYDSVIGLVCFVNKPATTESDLVTLLRSLGAIIYCKTNVPQTMMTADSDNNVYGRTLNPNNTTLTAGGSTGGEGALVALRGSILGVGTDIAGSIRIPSSCCGTYGFKPSSQRIPFAEQRDQVPDGMPGIAPSAGPIATSMRACQFFLKTVLEAKPSQFDDSVLRIPYQHIFDTFQPERLRIGIIQDDGLYTPTPPIRRGLHESIQKLKAAGHEIIPIKLPNVLQNMHLTWDFFSLDGCETVNELIESTSEPLVPSVQMTGLTVTPGKTLKELFTMNHQRSIACKDFNEIWRNHNLDVMLSPPAPHTALPFDQWKVITYTSLLNFYDVPGCIIPIGKVDQELDVKDDLSLYGEADKEVYKLYSGPEAYKDAPTTIQLIGQIQEDEKLAAIAVIIDAILNN